MSGVGASQWARAALAAAVFAVDPVGTRGLWIRARNGPVRTALLNWIGDVLPEMRKVHPAIDDNQLFGGLDLSATLQSGHKVQSKGILSTPGALCLTMAERCPARLAVRLGQASDAGTHGIVALDEGAEDDECAPNALTERLGMFVLLEGIPAGAVTAIDWSPAEIAAARKVLPEVSLSADAQEALVVVAARMGIASLRAPLLAAAIARVLAALAGQQLVERDDIQLAAELTLAHRGMVPLDEPAEAEAPQPGDPAPGNAEAQGENDPLAIPQDVLLEAVQAVLPPDVLAALATGRSRQARGAAGTGNRRVGNRRGRPLPSRPGRLSSDAHVDLVATLRAAAPWQPMRRAAAPASHRLHIRPEDIRLKRYEERSDRLLIFTVDASGSAAMARLAEVKGAVELLLAEAYARRDHVALVAFRGTAAEVLLPPTRSLVQTKRRLAALPGGGGTPLAAGLQTARDLADQASRRGMTPSIALLTDGRANIALNEEANRQAAAEDAEHLVRLCRAEGIPGIVIDTAARPHPALASLARQFGAPYLPLPRADAARLSAAVSDNLGP